MTTAWVTGAGFSAALGGPTLRTLLAPASGDNLLATYPDVKPLHDDLSRIARRMFAYGMRYSLGRFDEDKGREGEFLWSDAEQFVEYLDLAAGGGAAKERVKRILYRMDVANWDDIHLGDLRHTTRRLVAGECMAFLAGADLGGEKWEPFRTWLARLEVGDSLITFNYDLVVETIERWLLKKGANPPIARLLPNEPRSLAGSVPYVKLHGSVDWRRTEVANADVQFAESQHPLHALQAANEEIALATPGPTKLSAARELRELWDHALSFLRAADAVVFVGYRFPPSDAEARTKLLRAIEENKRDHIDLHVVLGPNLGEPDTVRMLSLLRYVAQRAGRHEVRYRGDGAGAPYPKRFTLTAHPLWAQDFFTVWDRETIWKQRVA